ncbi:MAG: hypothetical protein J6Y72_12985 [Bacteroidales bacterium]|nr:hypothetical protein [Bacteroidales bacterium]
MKNNKHLLSALAVVLIAACASNVFAQSARHANQQATSRTTTTSPKTNNGHNNAKNNVQNKTKNSGKTTNSNGYHSNGSVPTLVIPGAPRTIEPRRTHINKIHNGYKHIVTDPVVLHHYMRNHPTPPCRPFALYELRVGNVFSELPTGYQYVNINGEWLFSALGYLFRPIMIDGQILFTIIG